MNAQTAVFSDYESDEFLEDAPISTAITLAEAALSEDDREWVDWLCMRYLNMNREGATFLRLASNVFIIGIYGGQLIHHDRHLEMLPTEGFSAHTWNVIATPSEGQMLLTEDKDRIFRHHRLDQLEDMIYMNTQHHHLVSREKGDEISILVQADGYGPDQHEEAIKAIRDACAARNFMGMI